MLLPILREGEWGGHVLFHGLSKEKSPSVGTSGKGSWTVWTRHSLLVLQHRVGWTRA